VTSDEEPKEGAPKETGGEEPQLTADEEPKLAGNEEPREAGGEEPKLTAYEEPPLAGDDEPEVTETRWQRVRRPSWLMIAYAIGLLVILGVLGSLALSGTRGVGKPRGGSEEKVRGQRGKGKGTTPRAPKKKKRGGRVSALTEAAQPRTIDEASLEAGENAHAVSRRT
jgi:hypothetical protein